MFSVIVDSNEGDLLPPMVHAEEKRRLEVGDILIQDNVGTNTWIFERKTWGDGLNAWKSKRLQDQISRMIELHDNYALIVEGRPSDFYAPNPDDWGHFRSFLNRVSVEVCPVVFTDSIMETARYINAFKLRLEDDTQGHFVRPVTAVKSSRNAHHNLLQAFPGIGREKAKKIYELYPNLKTMMNTWGLAKDEGVIKGKTWINVEAFLNKSWGSQSEKPLIRERKRSETTQRSLDWWEQV
jgi:ERCC4-type nuclease